MVGTFRRIVDEVVTVGLMSRDSIRSNPRYAQFNMRIMVCKHRWLMVLITSEFAAKKLRVATQR
jgi:hypothetical protein